MSDVDAVAAVTDTLRALLQTAVGAVNGTVVTSRPPDEVATAAEASVLNVFLYRSTVDASWRNEYPPGVRPGESARPALPLVLHYLLTPYVPGEEAATDHRILGAAMAALHDNPVLAADLIRNAAPYSDLYLQPEAVRITPTNLSTEDISKLWAAFQSPYRMSAAYEARIVLIDSRRPGRTPLPVLRRGDADQGPVVVPSVTSPFPSLTGLAAAVARPGATVVLTGSRLDAGEWQLQLSPATASAPPVPPALAVRVVSATQAQADLPADLAAGLWSAALVPLPDDGSRRPTNAVDLPVAARITSAMPMQVARTGNGAVTVELTCDPPVRPGQRVQLLLGSRPVTADPIGQVTSRLRFALASATPGSYRVRLRVDGVDSVLFDPTAATPAFDPTQVVTVR